MTAAEVAKLLAIAAAAWPQARLSPETSLVWEDLLSDIEPGIASRALRRLVATSRWLPAISELRAECLALRQPTQRPAMQAWGDVLAAVHKYGYYGTPQFPCPITAAAVSALGWREICLSEHQASDRARFCEAYDQIARRAQSEAQIPERDRLSPARPLSLLLPRSGGEEP